MPWNAAKRLRTPRKASRTNNEEIDKFMDDVTRFNEDLIRSLSDVLNGLLNLGSGSELTISSGAVTIVQSFHSVDTESDASTDDLDTINGGRDGDVLVLSAANSARTVVVKDGTGNLKLGGDFSLDNAEDTISLIKSGSNWLETSRSDNGA